MQEQERIANEEAEKRLKAALTAKREPTSTASRVASPGVGNVTGSDIPVDSKLLAPETAVVLKEDSSMDIEATSVATTPPVPEVRLIFLNIHPLGPQDSSRVPGFLNFRRYSMKSKESRPEMHVILSGSDYRLIQVTLR